MQRGIHKGSGTWGFDRVLALCSGGACGLVQYKLTSFNESSSRKGDLRKKSQCIHDPSLIGLFNYIFLRKSKLIKLLHDIDETGTGPSMAPCCIFYFLEASPTRTQRGRTLFLSSLPKRITAAPEFEIFDFCQFFCNSTQNDPHY